MANAVLIESIGSLAIFLIIIDDLQLLMNHT